MDRKTVKNLTDVINNFDFEKVQDVMQYLNWTWADTENGVPELYELKEKATDLLIDSYENLIKNKEEEFFVGSGGFEASVWKDNDEYFFNLKFILTEI